MGKHDHESVCTYDGQAAAKSDAEELRVQRVLLAHLRQITRCETGSTQYEDILDWVSDRKKQARAVLDDGVPF